MTENHITHELESPPVELTKSLTIMLNEAMHEYTHEERMFWAMQYAIVEYERAETAGRDLTDYRIAADETANFERQNRDDDGVMQNTELGE